MSSCGARRATGKEDRATDSARRVTPLAASNQCTAAVALEPACGTGRRRRKTVGARGFICIASSGRSERTAVIVLSVGLESRSLVFSGFPVIAAFCSRCASCAQGGLDSRDGETLQRSPRRFSVRQIPPCGCDLRQYLKIALLLRKTSGNRMSSAGEQKNRHFAAGSFRTGCRMSRGHCPWANGPLRGCAPGDPIDDPATIIIE